MNQEQMKMRTKEFAKQVINLCRQLPNTREGQLIGNQFFRAGTSVGAKLPCCLPRTIESRFYLQAWYSIGRNR